MDDRKFGAIMNKLIEIQKDFKTTCSKEEYKQSKIETKNKN
jgi:hypothetical protein